MSAPCPGSVFALLAVLAVGGNARAQAHPLTLGVSGSIGPSEPLITDLGVGGWAGYALGDAWMIEVEGSYRRPQEGTLLRFLERESLLDPDSPLADAPAYTATLSARRTVLRGKLAALQSSVGRFALGASGGFGVRGLVSRDQSTTSAAVTGVGGLTLDVSPAARWVCRLGTALSTFVRRDDTWALVTDLSIGIGFRP
jgi:hypothetical protein